MGLPSATAVVLVGCGLERGLDEATRAAEACLIGLVASAAVPLVYAGAVRAGWRSPAAAAAAVGGYAAVAAALLWLPKPGAEGCVAVAAVGLAVACRLAATLRLNDPPGRSHGRPLPRPLLFASRSAIPAGSFLVVRLLRALAGAGFAGRFITFPGGSLAVLVATHLEAGPETACRTAAAMPAGGLAMLAFLTCFRFGCPLLGLGPGTAAGFASALGALGLVGWLTGREAREVPQPVAPPRTPTPSLVGRTAHGRPGSLRRDLAARYLGRPSIFGRRTRTRDRRRRRFSPRLETLAG
jgi:hypothetical protein